MRAEVPGERVEVNLAAERLGALVAEDGVAVPPSAMKLFMTTR